MKMYMILIWFVYFVLLGSTDIIAQDINGASIEAKHPLGDVEQPMYSQGSPTNKFMITITDNQMRDIQGWNPLKEQIPLSISNAVFSAKKWLKTEVVDADSYELFRIDLRRHVGFEEFVDKWLYLIEFQAVSNSVEKKQHFRYTAVCVLFDGTVVSLKRVAGDGVSEVDAKVRREAKGDKP